MKILALDTATASCSVAVIEGESLRAELTTLITETHSRHLLSMVATAIDMAGLQADQLDGFAVSIGPGSFTGLRIGISAIKGLAFSLRKPVVGISSLAALAWQCNPSPYLICPVIDARKKEVYFGRYRFNNGQLQAEGLEQVASPAAALRAINETCVFVGSGASLYREKIVSMLGRSAQFAAPGQHTIRASTVAWLSLERFAQNQTDDVELLVPHYIRKSDAELNLGRTA
jgi:tRNA threonylcarbamoyladenosine biosynthesis protein TsaB